MKPSLAVVIAAATIAVAFSGCAGTEVKIKSTLGGVYDFDQFHWNPPAAFDAEGHPIAADPLLSQPGAVPRGVQQTINKTFSFTPSIAATKGGKLLTISWDNILRSSDHGATWEKVHEFLVPEYPKSSDRFMSAASTLWVDPATNRAFAIFYNGGCDWLFFSDDEGSKWSAPTTSYPASCGDSRDVLSNLPKIITAKDGPKAPPVLPPKSYPNVFYLCESVAGLGGWTAAKCSVSYDGGATYAYENVLSTADHQCWASNAGTPAAYADGTVVVPLGPRTWIQNWKFGVDLSRKCNISPTVAVSEDNGITWSIRPSTIKTLQTELNPAVTVTPDGVAYLTYRGSDQFAYVVRSTDKFQTYQGPWRISPPNQTINKYVSITSGDNGRIAVSFLGTYQVQKPDAVPQNVSAKTHWHLFVTNSFDANTEAPTFVTHAVTPVEDPIETGPQLAPNLGLLQGMTHDAEGRFYVVLLDGCDSRNGCATDTTSGYTVSDRQLAVAAQDAGKSLFEANGILADLGLQHPRPLSHEQKPASSGNSTAGPR